MPLDNFDNLKAEVIAYSGRNDMQTRLDSMIAIVEAELYANTQNAVLRLQAMRTRSTATLGTTDRYLALPTGFLEMRRLRAWFTGETLDTSDLEFRTPDQLRINPIIGKPCYFSVTSQLEFERIPDQAYTAEMMYYAKITGLSDANPTNTILTNYPSIYLFGCLWMVYEWGDEPEKSLQYYGKMINAIAGANKQDELSRYGPAPVKRNKKATP